MIPDSHYLIVGSALFLLGLAIVITKKNAILVLMGIEIMLVASNLNLVGFSRGDAGYEGQFVALFILVVAATEVVVGIAMIIKLYKYFKTSNLDEMKSLKG